MELSLLFGHRIKTPFLRQQSRGGATDRGGQRDRPPGRVGFFLCRRKAARREMGVHFAARRFF
ncbi:MAG: hypothetical protein ACOX5G_02125 [Kiritimatiellia bacterium]